MKKEEPKRSYVKPILITLGVLFFVFIIVIPIMFIALSDIQIGNVAVIPVEGIITTNGASSLTQDTISSAVIVDFIEKASDNPSVQAIILEVNSPGGSPVASDEIATALKKVDKPTVAVIREVGASGGYWIATAADHIIANRMSITGSIGVISSYLEFSGFMDEYGIGHEQLIAGRNKDIGSPFKKLNVEQKAIMQGKLDTLHTFFIDEVAENRNMDPSKVRQLATGEFYLGIEAFNSGLIDALGDRETAAAYLKSKGITDPDYIYYQREVTFFEALAGAFSDFSFHVGQGIGSLFHSQENVVMFR
ncbi:TPA: signal peptide peptidase SppA [Candidatus Woesearchaeota archaeon]|nr:signal peptide peptidase SppA [archaeon]HIJ11786.1 signal peptide peptidase SppA [Candidatus Woesearchaeota archaeon]